MEGVAEFIPKAGDGLSSDFVDEFLHDVVRYVAFPTRSQRDFLDVLGEVHAARGQRRSSRCHEDLAFVPLRNDEYCMVWSEVNLDGLRGGSR
jgi:hypothetical protein